MREIISLFPEYLRDIYEIKHLCKALDRVFAKMSTILASLVGGVALNRPDPVGMEHWRKMLEDSDRLGNVDTKYKLMERLALDDNVNFEFITKYLDEQCFNVGHETTFDPDALLLTVKTEEVFHIRATVEKYLREVVPCNIELKIVVPEEAV